MGVVYEAEQLPLGRRVALKVLPSAASLDARQRQRFQLEAQAVALLQHEHIVPVYGVGFDNGVHYYAMQFIDGRSLAEIIRELRSDQSPAGESPRGGLSITTESSPESAVRKAGEPALLARSADHVRAAAQYGVQAALALQHAHDAGVIHRDI